MVRAPFALQPLLDIMRSYFTCISVHASSEELTNRDDQERGGGDEGGDEPSVIDYGGTHGGADEGVEPGWIEEMGDEWGNVKSWGLGLKKMHKRFGRFKWDWMNIAVLLLFVGSFGLYVL